MFSPQWFCCSPCIVEYQIENKVKIQIPKKKNQCVKEALVPCWAELPICNLPSRPEYLCSSFGPAKSSRQGIQVCCVCFGTSIYSTFITAMLYDIACKSSLHLLQMHFISWILKQSPAQVLMSVLLPVSKQSQRAGVKVDLSCAAELS